MISGAVSLGAPAPFAARAPAERPPRRSATNFSSRDASRRHAAPARSVRARVINNDAPAGAFSSADDADGRDVIGQDEFGVSIRGDRRRASPERDAYWREQALELESALVASGDASRVVITDKGVIELHPAERTTHPSDAIRRATVELERAEATRAAEREKTRDASRASSAAAAPEAAVVSAAGEIPEAKGGWRGHRTLFAQIAVLGLPALVNSCIEPVLSSAETACAAKIGTIYLAALAPSSSLFAFAAEMCFAVSVVVTTAVAKAAAGTAEDPEHLPRTATAAVTASFVSGGVLAVALTALAGPLLGLMHVPAEVAPLVRLYVGVRALGLPFFAASNAAEGVFVGQRDGVTPMWAWMCTGAATLAMLLAAAHPAALGLGLPGAAAAISLGQMATGVWFFARMRAEGLLVWPTRAETETEPKMTAEAEPESPSTPPPASVLASFAEVCGEAVGVLTRSRMLNEIGWLFLGAVSRMGTYAAVTASASALGVVPGATHKVALETFWLLSFFTEPIFTACNALLPREISAGRLASARKLRDALVACAVALGGALACAGAAMTKLAVYSDDPAVTATLATLVVPVATCLGLSAVAYGVEGTIIGVGEVGYLGRTHARDFFVVLCLLKVNETLGGIGGGGLAGIWWVLAGFQGLRIAQHWFHLWRNRPFHRVEAKAEDGKEPPLTEVAGLALA